ncbi:hypothetical protein AB0K05_24865 [Nonomuraea sp. NPDC049486]|uniref:hypothetical protein n=1 Tax=Nonomuraea sp. NPDC049486 TaxID=3155773 RepID=UPI00342757C2
MMTPEEAAENAAKVLDLAVDEADCNPNFVNALIAIADAWTRLHTALAATQPRIPAPTVTSHSDDMPVLGGDLAAHALPEPPDLSPIRAALVQLPVTCQHHGNNTKPRDGFPGREACCDSGIPARRRRLAAETLQALSDFFHI